MGNHDVVNIQVNVQKSLVFLTQLNKLLEIRLTDFLLRIEILDFFENHRKIPGKMLGFNLSIHKLLRNLK